MPVQTRDPVDVVLPESLGDPAFRAAHGVRLAYVVGEMANGIATTAMVRAAAEAGMLGFFGAAGLAPDRVAADVAELAAALPGRHNWGVNLIHTPADPDLEHRVVEIAVANRVPVVSASAFRALTPAVVRCAATGLSLDRTGAVVRRTRIAAKVSRPEVAAQFMAPPPGEILDHLVASGQLTETEAALARRVPVAEDITAEADSGGHTDNRPLGVLLPTLFAVRDTVARTHGCPPVRVGAAGGLGTPEAVTGGFAMGAAYVLTGSVNQVAVESGLSAAAKDLLCRADIADTVMAPSADMFEQGVKVQVLRRGLLYPGRAAQLYEAYRNYGSLEEITGATRAALEKNILRESFASAWAATRTYWLARDPAQVTRAERDPRHRMALVFRGYLGRSSHWAIEGDPLRASDYQIWCGPATGAFNRWVEGSFLARADSRTVAEIGMNLMAGAAWVARAHQLRLMGVPVPDDAARWRPRPLS